MRERGREGRKGWREEDKRKKKRHMIHEILTGLLTWP